MERRGRARSRGGLGLYQRAWWCLAVPVGAVGLAAVWLGLGSGISLLLLTGLALAAGLGAWQFASQRGDKQPGLHATAFGTASSLGFLALVGLGWTMGPVGLAGGAVLGAAGWPALRHRQPVTRPERPAGPALERLPAPPLPDASALHGLSTPKLCWTWRASYVCLIRSPWPSYMDNLTDLRRACLDELERRDPVAFAHWLPTARAAGDPARYFCQQSQR